MSNRAASVFLLGLVIVIGMCAVALIVYVVVSHVWRLFSAWQDKRDLRIRNENINRYCMGSFKAVTKDWRL